MTAIRIPLQKNVIFYRMHGALLQGTLAAVLSKSLVFATDIHISGIFFNPEMPWMCYYYAFQVHIFDFFSRVLGA